MLTLNLPIHRNRSKSKHIPIRFQIRKIIQEYHWIQESQWIEINRIWIFFWCLESTLLQRYPTYTYIYKICKVVEFWWKSTRNALKAREAYIFFYENRGKNRPPLPNRWFAVVVWLKSRERETVGAQWRQNVCFSSSVFAVINFDICFVHVREIRASVASG